MPEVCRVDVDLHIGHASPTPNPFHRTAYAQGSSDVKTNDQKTVRVGDKTYCGDPAKVGSGSVLVNGIPVHRNRDATKGHSSWVPNAASSGSPDVIAGD
jgi:hypothetical protein